jgi:hypothetical protein
MQRHPYEWPILAENHWPNHGREMTTLQRHLPPCSRRDLTYCRNVLGCGLVSRSRLWLHCWGLSRLAEAGQLFCASPASPKAKALLDNGFVLRTSDDRTELGG